MDGFDSAEYERKKQQEAIIRINQTLQNSALSDYTMSKFGLFDRDKAVNNLLNLRDPSTRAEYSSLRTQITFKTSENNTPSFGLENTAVKQLKDMQLGELEDKAENLLTKFYKKK